MKHKVLDLFSGIGGFSLGLERTGYFETVAFCEQDQYCQKILNKHWPTIPIYNDVTELTNEQLKSDGIIPSVITLGFPCQDISSAGQGKGIIGKRSGLWSEAFRLIGDVRPTWAIVENVSVLRSKGLALVLQNLSEIGYYAEWHCIPASSVGAPHRRDRVWIIAHCDPNENCKPIMSKHDEASRLSEHDRNTDRSNEQKVGEVQGGKETKPGRICGGVPATSNVADTDDIRSEERHEKCTKSVGQRETYNALPRSEVVADTMRQSQAQRGEREIVESEGDGGRDESRRSEGDIERQRPIRGTGSNTEDELADSGSMRWGRGNSAGCPDEEQFILQGEQGRDTVGSQTQGCGSSHGEPTQDELADTDSEGSQRHGEEMGGFGEVRTQETTSVFSGSGGENFWEFEPDVGRVAHGIPKRVDRLKCLGNSLVPQIPELIGRSIVEFEVRLAHDEAI